jgi:hypothetical protein
MKKSIQMKFNLRGNQDKLCPVNFNEIEHDK